MPMLLTALIRLAGIGRCRGGCLRADAARARGTRRARDVRAASGWTTPR